MTDRLVHLSTFKEAWFKEDKISMKSQMYKSRREGEQLSVNDLDTNT